MPPRNTAPITANLEPLGVSPRTAADLLGIGNTHLYKLLGNGELDSYLDGRARRITMSSIKRRIERRLAASDSLLSGRSSKSKAGIAPI
jgi:excisionase family DNA binding protein